ncbi:MAG: hypothetical protein AAF985_15310 [Bacteroidota bacterium]
MKQKIIAILLSFLFLFSAQPSLEAQSFKDRYFHSFGYIFEYVQAPPFVIGAARSQFDYYSVGIQYEARVNIANLSDNMAVSASAAPSFGLAFSSEGIDGLGWGALNLPFFANLELGAGSTYDSDANFGATFGIGFNYTRFPLFGSDLGPNITKSYTTPIIRASIRKFSSSGNHLREYFLQLWPFGSEDGTGGETLKTLVIRVGYSKFFGY